MVQLIVSDEILLKQLEETDAATIFQIIDSQREYLGEWLPFVASTKTIDDTLGFIRSVNETPESFRELVFLHILPQRICWSYRFEI